MDVKAITNEMHDESVQSQQDVHEKEESHVKLVIPPKKKKLDQQDLLKQACNYFSKTENSGADYLAKSWAIKLKSLDKFQRIYAEKAINEILLEAELGNLTKNSVKINETECSVTSTPLKKILAECILQLPTQQPTMKIHHIHNYLSTSYHFNKSFD